MALGDCNWVGLLAPVETMEVRNIYLSAAIIAIGTAAIGVLGILSTLGAGAANAAGIPATVLRTLRAELTRPDAV